MYLSTTSEGSVRTLVAEPLRVGANVGAHMRHQPAMPLVPADPVGRSAPLGFAVSRADITDDRKSYTVAVPPCCGLKVLQGTWRQSLLQRRQVAPR